MIEEHIDRDNWIDVANLAMFMSLRDDPHMSAVDQELYATRTNMNIPDESAENGANVHVRELVEALRWFEWSNKFMSFPKTSQKNGERLAAAVRELSWAVVAAGDCGTAGRWRTCYDLARKVQEMNG